MKNNFEYTFGNLVLRFSTTRKDNKIIDNVYISFKDTENSYILENFLKRMRKRFGGDSFTVNGNVIETDKRIITPIPEKTDEEIKYRYRKHSLKRTYFNKRVVKIYFNAIADYLNLLNNKASKINSTYYAKQYRIIRDYTGVNNLLKKFIK